MKNRIIGFFVILFFSMSVSAQNIEENTSLRLQVNTIFENLDKSKVSSGFLIDYSIPLVDYNMYDGTLTDSNYVNLIAFDKIYRTFYSAQVNGNIIPSVSDYMTDYEDACNLSEGVILGGLLLQYQEIRFRKSD